MGVVTGNEQVDSVITVVVTYLFTFAYGAYDAAKKFYIFYPDVAIATSIVVGVFFLVYFIRNIVAIVYGLILTAIKLTILLTIVSAGSYFYFRGFDNVQTDIKAVVSFVSHYDKLALDSAKDYASNLKDHTGPIKEYISSYAA